MRGLEIQLDPATKTVLVDATNTTPPPTTNSRKSRRGKPIDLPIVFATQPGRGTVSGLVKAKSIAEGADTNHSEKREQSADGRSKKVKTEEFPSLTDAPTDQSTAMWPLTHDKMEASISTMIAAQMQLVVSGLMGQIKSTVREEMRSDQMSIDKELELLQENDDIPAIVAEIDKKCKNNHLSDTAVAPITQGSYLVSIPLTTDGDTVFNELTPAEDDDDLMCE